MVVRFESQISTCMALLVKLCNIYGILVLFQYRKAQAKKDCLVTAAYISYIELHLMVHGTEPKIRVLKGSWVNAMTGAGCDS